MLDVEQRTPDLHARYSSRFLGCAPSANPTIGCSFGGVMGRGRKTAANKAKPPNKVDPKTQAKRQRITEDIARVLREAGYECSDEPDQPKLRRDN